MKWSILIPTIRGREKQLKNLLNYLEDLIGDKEIEVLWLGDNKKRSIGFKRQSLLEVAKGKYISFVDDDEFISFDYVDEIYKRLIGHDVITFNSIATLKNDHGEIDIGYIEMKMGNPMEQFKPRDTTKRPPFHCCVWKRDIALMSSFTNSNHGEDSDWLEGAVKYVVNDIHIDKYLHYYIKW
jgi:hypothetical protein